MNDNNVYSQANTLYIYVNIGNAQSPEEGAYRNTYTLSKGQRRQLPYRLFRFLEDMGLANCYWCLGVANICGDCHREMLLAVLPTITCWFHILLVIMLCGFLCLSLFTKCFRFVLLFISCGKRRTTFPSFYLLVLSFPLLTVPLSFCFHLGAHSPAWNSYGATASTTGF